MATDTAIAKNLEAGYLASALGSNANAVAQVAKENQRTYTVLVADAATAGTAVTETIVGTVPYACRVISWKVSTPIAVTASDTTYATFSGARRTAAGGTSTAIAVQTSKITAGLGNMTAFAAYSLDLTAANTELVAGAQLTFAIAKASTGVALTAATSYVNVTVVTEDI